MVFTQVHKRAQKQGEGALLFLYKEKCKFKVLPKDSKVGYPHLNMCSTPRVLGPSLTRLYWVVLEGVQRLELLQFARG